MERGNWAGLQGNKHSSFYSHIDIAEVRTEDGKLYIEVHPRRAPQEGQALGG
jgi:hypothetical protein